MNQNMNLNDWAREIHANSCAHGWWDEERPLPEILMLIVSELSEALEEARKGDPMPGRISCMHYYGGNGVACTVQSERHPKPEGIAVEVIDALIRILDWCGKEGLDVEALVTEKHKYNKTRPYKHGKKF